MWRQRAEPWAQAIRVGQERLDMEVLRQFVRDERGQDLIEYGLLCGFVTLGVVVATTNLGQAVNGIFGGIGTQVASIPAP